MGEVERWRRVRSIFDRAVEMPEPQRAQLLDRECADDSSLRDEVESLLRADQEDSAIGLTGAVSSALQDSTMAVAVGDQVGPYRIVGELGRGGMGVVLAGERDDGTYRKEVAIKLLPGALHSESAKRRFLDERQILANLEHPSIAGLLDGGSTEAGLNYLVMERVDGQAIDQYCDTHGLGIRDRVRLMIQVCHAISHAHSRLVVHRDIKPSNVLVTQEGVPKLLDFGIAKLMDPSGNTPIHQTVDWFLTPEFASPEQIEGRPITAATDVYGLGALLYLLLTGQSPLAGVAKSPTELMHAIVHTTPEPPSLAAGRTGHRLTPARHISRDLDAIVGQALRKEPSRRYSSAEQLAADLQRFLSDRPVKAIPDSLYYRAGKFLRRQWIPVTAAILAGASLAAGFSAREIESRRAQREAQTATQVAEFLESLFSAATPQEQLGRDLSAEDLLDRGAERIQLELADQPRLQARLLDSIAGCYRSLGQYDEAQALYQKVLEFRSRELGARHLETADSLFDIGLVHSHAGRFAEGESFMRRAIAIYEDKLPNDHISLLNALSELAGNLASQARSAAKLKEAEQLLLRAGAFYQRHADSYSEEYTLHLRDLSRLYWEQGNHQKLIPTLQQAVTQATDLFGPRDPFTLGTQSFLATALYEVGELEQVDAIMADLCPLIIEVYGPDHDEVSGCLRTQGAAWVKLGRLHQAEAILERALELEKTIYGEDHHYVAAIQIHIMELRLEQGNLAAAGLLVTPTLETLERGYGGGHQIMGDALEIAARVRLAEGLDEAAESLLNRALAIGAQTYGQDSLRVRQTEALLQQISRSRSQS